MFVPEVEQMSVAELQYIIGQKEYTFGYWIGKENLKCPSIILSFYEAGIHDLG